ncbi:ANTAR domain-containing protein [Psychromonas sp. MME2]|uniref:ANTAR domain-containing response regulator n=1 Tax=unclassified Psychromonas TaxID=2614957 RepID=UPI00339D0A73
MNKTDRENHQHQSNSILLVEEQFTHHSILKQTLENSGYVICKHLHGETTLYEEISKYEPDLLLLNIVQPSQKTLHELAKIHQLAPLNVIIFAEKDCPLSMQASIKAGVSSYIVDKVPADRLNSIISVAQQRFVEHQALREALEQAKTELITRKLLEQAKGLLMQQKNISEQQADENLRQMAIDNGQSLAVIAHNVIEVSGLLQIKIKH